MLQYSFQSYFLTKLIILTYNLYICLQELWIISFSVVSITEKSLICQLDLGLFLAWLERTVYKTKLGNDLFKGIIKRKKINSLIWWEWLSLLYAIQVHCWFDEKKRPKSSWQHRDFSVMFTTENEIIHSSWRQIYRLWDTYTNYSFHIL